MLSASAFNFCLPCDQKELKIEDAELETKSGIVQVFGAIGSTHIPIMVPSTNSKEY